MNIQDLIYDDIISDHHVLNVFDKDAFDPDSDPDDPDDTDDFEDRDDSSDKEELTSPFFIFFKDFMKGNIIIIEKGLDIE